MSSPTIQPPEDPANVLPRLRSYLSDKQLRSELTAAATCPPGRSGANSLATVLLTRLAVDALRVAHLTTKPAGDPTATVTAVASRMEELLAPHLADENIEAHVGVAFHAALTEAGGC